MLKEFKKFIARGNVLDLAVGVIIGGAFSAIVTSLVDNILTPLIGICFGGIDFSNLAITVGKAKIMYGAFIQSIIDFLIVAFCLFIIVKFMNKVTEDLKKAEKKLKKEEEKKEEAAPAPKSDEVVLLEQIRDLLKKGNK